MPYIEVSTSGLGAIKRFIGMINFKISCSTELKMKFVMIILNVKMPTIVSMVKTRLIICNHERSVFFQHLRFYEQLKYHTQLS